MLGFHTIGSTPLGSNSPYDLLYANAALETAGILLSGELKLAANAAYLELELDPATGSATAGAQIVGSVPNITLNDTTPVYEERNLIRTTDFSSFQVSTGLERPTGWSRAGSLNYENQGVGEDEHGKYWQVRIHGTATGTTHRLIFHPNTTSGYIPSSVGDTFSGQFGVKLISHSGAVSSVVLSLASRSATNAQLQGFSTSRTISLLTTDGFFKFERTATFTHEETASVGLEMRFGGIAIGESADFVLRIYTPQLERGGIVTPFQETGPTAIPTTTAIYAETPVNANLLLDSGAALSLGAGEISTEARFEQTSGATFSTASVEAGIDAVLQSGALDPISYTLEGLNVFTGELDLTLSPVFGRVNIIPNSANIGGDTWQGWWKRPTYNSGETDPFGGNTAVSYPLSECTGGPEADAAGFIAYAEEDFDNIDQVPSVWLKADVPMLVGLRARGGNSSQMFWVTTEWERYWFASPASGSSFPKRVIQIELSYSGGNAGLPPEARLYVACPQTNFGTEPLDYVPTYNDGNTGPFAIGQAVVGLTLDKTTGAPAFVSVGYAATDVIVDATTGLAYLASDAKPTISVIAIPTIGSATSTASVGATADARVQKGTDPVSHTAQAENTPSATFNKPSSPATILATGNSMGQGGLEGTLGNVSVVSVASAPLKIDAAITTTTPALNSLLQISVVGRGLASALPVEILAEAGSIINAALEMGADPAQIVSEVGLVIDVALDVLAGAAASTATAKPVVAGSLGEELADTVIVSLLEAVIGSALIKDLGALTHNAVGQTIVGVRLVTDTEAAELSSMVYRVVRRVLMTPRTLRVSTAKPMTDYTPVYS